jgi:hypothetical protein
MAIIKNTNNNKHWCRCEEKGNLTNCWWEYKLVQSLWKTVWKFLKKLKIELPYDPTIPLLCIYLKEWESEYNKDSCTRMFVTAHFTIAKLWKQSKCSITDKCIKKLMYIHIYTHIHISI